MGFVKPADMETGVLREIVGNVDEIRSKIPAGVDPDIAERMERVLAKAQRLASEELAKRA